MKIEGVYSAQTYSHQTQKFETGLVFIEDGKIRGCHNSLVIVGSYKIEGGEIKATIVARRHANDDPTKSLGEEMDLKFKGPVTDNRIIEMSGVVPSHPPHTITLNLTRLAEIESQ